MKKTLFILLLLSSCSKEEESDNGCQSGIPKTGGDRVTFRCCTKQQSLAGDNVSAGGTVLFTQFTQVQWAKCSDCK